MQMHIRTGDTLLVKSLNPSFLANQIQWFQGCDYHHAGTVYIFKEKQYIVEMLESGIEMTDFKLYENRLKTADAELMILRPTLTYVDNYYNDWMKAKYEQVIGKLLMKGVPYDFSNLLGHQAFKYAMYKLIGKKVWIGRIRGADNRFVCGESAAYIQNEVLGIIPKWYKYAPQDLFVDPNFIHYDYTLEAS